MKTFAARLSVVVLAFTAFTASTIVSKAAPRKSEIKSIAAGVICPAPMCPLSNPGPCGLD